MSLNVLGNVLLRQGDFIAARRLLEEDVALQRQIGDRFLLAYSLAALGQLATAERHYTEARAALRESLRLRQDTGDRTGIAESLDSIAALAAAESHPERAIQLAGAAASIREGIGARLAPMGRTILARWLVPLREDHGEEATNVAWEAGRAMSVDRAVQLALAATEAPATGSNRPPSHAGQQGTLLSLREQEVAALLGHGLTNRQIAVRLVITERTVGAHIGHILDKLGFNSRHQVGAWASDHGLLD